MPSDLPPQVPVPVGGVLRRDVLAGVKAFLARKREHDLWDGRGWTMLLAAAVFIPLERMLFVFVAVPPTQYVESDMQGYVERAWRLATSFSTLNRFDTFFPPGMHMLMTPAFLITRDHAWGLFLNQCFIYVMSVSSYAAVAYLAFRLFRHSFPAAITVWLLEGYVPYAQYSGFFLSEMPFTLFMTLTVISFLNACESTGTRRWHLVTGLLAGIAITIRPQFAVTTLLLFTWLLARRSSVSRFKGTIAFVLAAAVPVVSGLAVNAHAAHQRVGLANNGGFNFYQGHCEVDTVRTESKAGVLIFSSPARLQRIEREGRAETETVIRDHIAWEDGYFYNLGLDCIRADGLGHLKRIVGNILDFFPLTNPWPASTGPLAPVSGFMNWLYCILVLLVLPQAFRRARTLNTERLLLLLLSTTLPVPILYYGDSRFRVPYDIFGIMLVAGTIAVWTHSRRDTNSVVT